MGGEDVVATVKEQGEGSTPINGPLDLIIPHIHRYPDPIVEVPPWPTVLSNLVLCRPVRPL
jgi:hypothetical protein